MSDVVPIADNSDVLDVFEKAKNILGPVYKDSDEDIFKTQIQIISDECLSVSNRMFETTITDLKSIVVDVAIIWYQNRGVESQTRQDELGQANYFIDWHHYLQEEIVRHGKRYVI